MMGELKEEECKHGDKHSDVDAEYLEEQERLLKLVRSGEIFSYVQALKTTIKLLQREKKHMKRTYEERLKAAASDHEKDVFYEAAENEEERKDCEDPVAPDKDEDNDNTSTSESEEEESSGDPDDSSLPDHIYSCDNEIMIEVLKDENIKLQSQAGSLMAILEQQNLSHQTLRESATKFEEENKKFSKRILELEHDIRKLIATNQSQEVSIGQMQNDYKEREALAKQKENEDAVEWNRLVSRLNEYEDENERLTARCSGMETIVRKWENNESVLDFVNECSPSKQRKPGILQAAGNGLKQANQSIARLGWGPSKTKQSFTSQCDFGKKMANACVANYKKAHGK